MKRLLVLAIVFWLSWRQCLADSPVAELIEVNKIWDQAPHCAFTDLAYWKDQFVCAFREGRGHMSTDGKIRVLTSPDGDKWKSAALVSLHGYDLRDAGLSRAPGSRISRVPGRPDGRLMLIGGASPRKTDQDRAPTGSFVSFSEDGVTWTEPRIVSDPGRWLWRVTWHQGKAYGVSYAAAGTRHTDQPGAGSEPRFSALVTSDDGTQFRDLVPKLSADGWPTEAVLRFNDDDTVYCLQRRDGQSPLNTAMLGVSKPPYTQWEWRDLGLYFGGPNFIQIPGGRWVAAGRVFRDDGPKTELAWLDVDEKNLSPFLQLPSGGDTSYPGLVWHDGVLWVSYYSSHEGKANIYIAKVKLSPADSALTSGQLKACERLGLDEKEVAELVGKPLYKFTEAEVDTYLQFVSATEPDLRKRIVQLARKNIAQPYEIYLLGEMPFEPYDPQPLYCLGKSDCLVFTEHTYAMALSHNWPSFMKMLQRLRYRDGKLGVATRNHYTEADWNVSNRWLVEDITEKLAGGAAVKFEQSIDRAKFLKNRYGLDVDIPVERHENVFLPFEKIDRAKGELRDGDFVNVVRGVVSKDAAPSEIFGGNAWVGHVGLVVRGDDGEMHMIHSSEPKVREEPIDEYIARSTKSLAENDAAGKARLLGFKFLRLRDDPLKHLREIDGDDAPRVTLPSGGELKLIATP